MIYLPGVGVGIQLLPDSAFVGRLLVLWLQLCAYRDRKARSRKWWGHFSDPLAGSSPWVRKKDVAVRSR